MAALPPLPLPAGVRSRYIDTSPVGLSFHILEAGYSAERDRPLVLLLHGFPDLAFSWRKVLPLLASKGYYAVAPDQRGYGRTTGWDMRGYGDVDLSTFSATNLVRDVIVLTSALGYKSVECVVGHDFGALPASFCVISRPDIFKSVALLAHPFKGSPELPFNVTDSARADHDSAVQRRLGVHEDLTRMGLKQYRAYYATERANLEMLEPPEGLHNFLRGYFYLKSASWSGNRPHPLESFTATELAKMPSYYIMPLDKSMPAAVAADIASGNYDTSLSKNWLSDAELDVYVSEFCRTGFQAALNWYRVLLAPNMNTRDLDIFSGRKIDRPCCYASGTKDWGTYQEPGAIEKMKNGDVCDDFRGLTFSEKAGHFMPQEDPEATVEVILSLVRGL